MNTTQTRLTFESVEEIFERVYARLREESGENAPSSWTWFARTREALVESTGELGGDGELSVHSEGLLGDVNAPIIAWTWECNGFTLTEIHEGATEDDVEELFRLSMGFDD
jgi:hypothetical protein